MKREKIGENHSIQNLKNIFKGAEILQTVLQTASFFGYNNGELKNEIEKIINMKSDLTLFSKGLDKFNHYFAQRGWIAHESMSTELMLKVVELAEQGQLDLAEQELIDYYSSNDIEQRIMFFIGIPELYMRYELIKLAYDDTISGRYHACIPNLLMIIDGCVNDIDKGKGFFAENINLTAWDSIAAHSTGLSVIKEIFNSPRTKTTTEEITLPYRNGILHGRDLGYANRTVTAKCWAALFAIRDWAS